MEKDKLEQFILDNREAMDQLEPNPKIWAKIDADINPAKPNTIIYWLLGIIGVLVAAVSLLLGMQMGTSKTIEPTYFASEEQYNEFRETEEFYTTMVDYKLDQMGNTNESLQVRNDLDQLDQVFDELKQELLASPNYDNEMIISLMISNYKTKIEILEKVLSKSSEKINSNEENIFNNETINL